MTQPSSEAVAVPADAGADARRGMVLGLSSAAGYSAANLALRELSSVDPEIGWAIWVSAMKAVPTMILASILLARRRIRKQPLYPTTRPVPMLIVAGLVMQFGGNLGFQLALGHIGLAISVPVVFAFIILAGAVLGRVFLGDQVSKRTVLSILVMMAAIILLSFAATQADDSGQRASGYAEGVAWLGLIIAMISGLSYGVNGVILRHSARRTLPVESVLLIYSTTGVICLATLGIGLLGFDRLTQVTTAQWQAMWFAGTFNAIAFFCVVHALKLLNITQVNVVNAAQNAMCAGGAVLFFNEPGSPAMILGVLLSIAGLVMLDRK